MGAGVSESHEVHRPRQPLMGLRVRDQKPKYLIALAYRGARRSRDDGTICRAEPRCAEAADRACLMACFAVRLWDASTDQHVRLSRQSADGSGIASASILWTGPVFLRLTCRVQRGLPLSVY